MPKLLVRIELTVAQRQTIVNGNVDSYKDNSIQCQVTSIGELLSDSAVAQELVLDSDGLHSVVQVLNGLACLVKMHVFSKVQLRSLVIIGSVRCCVMISSFV